MIKVIGNLTKDTKDKIKLITMENSIDNIVTMIDQLKGFKEVQDKNITNIIRNTRVLTRITTINIQINLIIRIIKNIPKNKIFMKKEISLIFIAKNRIISKMKKIFMKGKIKEEIKLMIKVIMIKKITAKNQRISIEEIFIIKIPFKMIIIKIIEKIQINIMMK